MNPVPAMKSANCSIGEHKKCLQVYRAAPTDWICECACHHQGENQDDSTAEDASMTAPRSLLAQLFDWQVLRYGDSPETRAALAYWRERGWGVDDRDDQFIDVRISAFQAGYRVAAALSRLGGPQEPEKEPKIKT